jgi:hypothetical protein
MNKWLYKNVTWLYSYIANVRINWYMFTKQIQKSKNIITEHMDW